MAAGKVADRASSAKQQRYVGEFELDSRLPYTVREAHDEKGERRRIIVFRLRPKGAYERLSQDVITRAEETDTQRVSATVVTSKMVEPTRKRASESRRAAQPSLIADLRQSALREEYLKELTLREHYVFAYQVKIAGTTTILKTDLYDATEHELYAIRGSSSREEVRTAIGQLKDLVRHIKPRNPKLTVLLPERPHDDLLHLLHTEGIDIVYDGADGYTRHEAK
jgi:5-methylcytosine-specific restriction protein A